MDLISWREVNDLEFWELRSRTIPEADVSP